MTTVAGGRRPTRSIHDLKIGPRLALGFVVIILLMASMNAILLRQLHVIRAQTTHLNSIDRKLIAVLRVHTNLVSFNDRLEKLVQPEDAAQMMREATELRSALVSEGATTREALSRLPSDVQLDPALALSLQAVHGSMASQLQTITELASVGDWNGVRLRLTREIRPLQSMTSRLVADVSRQVEDERAEAFRSIGDADRRIVWTVTIAGVLTVFLAGVLGIVTTRSITEPLGRLMRGSQALARSDFGHRVAVQGSDEFAHLGRVFNDTAGTLRELYDTMEALKEDFRLAVDTIPGLVWSALPDGQVDFLNQRWREYTGMSLEEAGGWGWQAAVHPQDLPRLLVIWRGLVASGSTGEVEARLRARDGTYRWFLFRAVPLRDEGGRLVKWYGQTTDIEDRKRAETLLEAEKALLEIIAKGGALPSFLDALCRRVEGLAPGCLCSVLLVDRGGQRLHHGAAPSLPSSYNEARDGTSLDPEAGPCRRAASLKEQVIVEDVASDARWEASGWRTLALEHGLRSCWSTPFVSPDGRVLGTFALYSRSPGRPTEQHRTVIDQFTHVARIAVERAQTEDELRRSEASLAEALRLTQTGSWRWRPATGEVEWSIETYRIYGIDPSVTPTLEMALDRVLPEDKAVFIKTAERAVPEGRNLAFDLRLLMADGSLRHVRTVGQPMKDSTGQVVEFVGAVREMTKERQAEEEQEKLRTELAHVARVATLGELTASIAHEVNQPLSGIMTNASTCLRLLAATPPRLEEAGETARRTLRDGKRAAEVISRLRELFKKRAPARESVDANEAIREVVALTRHQLQTRRVVIRTELAEDLPPVVGDRVQLQQVVLNLILNAAEAMSGVEDRPRELVVATMQDAVDQVRVAVRDSGVGLDPEAKERIFEAFYTSKREGMGMGLSIARSIVERHGGRLWAVPNDGPGATFVFTLPHGPAPGIPPGGPTHTKG